MVGSWRTGWGSSMPDIVRVDLENTISAGLGNGSGELRVLRIKMMGELPRVRNVVSGAAGREGADFEFADAAGLVLITHDTAFLSQGLELSDQSSVHGISRQRAARASYDLLVGGFRLLDRHWHRWVEERRGREGPARA